MTGAVLLRKMNPGGEAGYRTPSERWLGGNSWESGTSEGENVRLPGETEEKTYEEVECGGKSCAGGWVGRASGGGAGCSKEARGTQGGSESGARGACKCVLHSGRGGRHGVRFSWGTTR